MPPGLTDAERTAAQTCGAGSRCRIGGQTAPLLTEHGQRRHRQIARGLTENSRGCPALRCVPVLLGAPLAVVMAPLGLLPDRMSFKRFSASCSGRVHACQDDLAWLGK